MPRTWLEVSLDQIALNYRMIHRTAGPGVELMPVVKADAYRHGATAVAQTLEREGTPWLAVSNVDEGKALREAGIRTPVLVMADRIDTDPRAWREHRLTPVIHDLDEIPLLDAETAYHLKLDSGMSRLGTNATLESIVSATRGTRLEGIMTHFASSADFQGGQTQRQVEVFESIRDGLAAAGIRPRYVHSASTNPLHFGLRHTWGNIVRPGYAMYGYVSRAKGKPPEELLEVAPALAWKARILLAKEVKAGTPIGYGGIYTADRAMRIGILGAGYADGLPHRLSNKGRVIAGGQYAPILGSVSMDVTTIDLSAAPRLKAGDTVTLLGREGDLRIDARDIARTAGTIAYSVLCGISSRVPRIYV
jgi:alanine racemase